MKTVGIVAEYNPFHNGHKYQIDQIRKQTNADNIVIVMSGNFVQRGGLAWTDKYLRTQMAIQCGADLVFELPVVFSCASAEIFALGAVKLLDTLGFVDEICFGSEEGNLEILKKISSILDSSDHIKELEIYLKKGMSFPMAREEYLKQHMPEYSDILPTLLKQPNNILGIEYIKALKKTGSHIKPVTIKRIDSGYHSTNLDNTPCSNESLKFSSASAIRTAFKNINFFSAAKEKEAALNNIDKHLPAPVVNILRNNMTHFPVDNSLFSDMLYFKLLSMEKEKQPLDIFSDVSPELSDRIYNNLSEYRNFDSFSDILKTKQYTHTRITRALTHILLDIKKEDMDLFVPSHIYARLLGMNKHKSMLLRNIQNIPLITKVADADKTFEKFISQSQNDSTNSKSSVIASDQKNRQTISIINEQQLRSIEQLKKMFKYDLFAADLYRFCTKNNVPDEYRAGIYILH